MHSEELNETSTPPTKNHFSGGQGSEIDCVTRSVGELSGVGQKPRHISIGINRDDCNSTSSFKQGGTEVVGGILKQLVDQNRALIEMLEAQNELLSKITIAETED